MFIIDWIKREIIVVEVGITSYNNLRTVETEKPRKYDLLANYLSGLHGFKTKIIPFVITWDGIVTTYHKIILYGIRGRWFYPGLTAI